MKTSDPTLLGYALLALIHQAPRSGYDLRKLFATTPLMSFSDSPGAIYPALKKLEQAGLIRSAVRKQGLRQKRVFRLSPSGLAKLKTWLTRPIERQDIIRNLDQLLVRFGFMDETVGVEGSAALLRQMESGLAAYLPELQTFLATHGPAMPLSGRLALESGISSYKSFLVWSRYALRQYEVSRKRVVHETP
jgi:DNA-binding PadR family transcriptional regulator